MYRNLLILITTQLTVSDASNKAAREMYWQEDSSWIGAVASVGELLKDSVDNVRHCALACTGHNQCESFFFSNETKMCQLHNTSYRNNDTFIASKGSVYYIPVCLHQGYTYVKRFNVCYKVVLDLLYDWATANNYCQQQDGWMINLDETGKHEYYLDLLKNTPDYAGKKYWVGLTDAATENTWVWTHTGSIEPAISIKWKPTQPDDSNGGQDCVQIAGANLYYDDAKCHQLKRFICEGPLM